MRITTTLTITLALAFAGLTNPAAASIVYYYNYNNGATLSHSDTTTLTPIDHDLNPESHLATPTTRPASTKSDAAFSAFSTAAGGTLGLENFEVVLDKGDSNNPVPVNTTLTPSTFATGWLLEFAGISGLTATLTTNQGVRLANVPTGTSAGRFPYSGDQFFDDNHGGTGLSVTLTFSSPIKAFGFFGSDIGDTVTGTSQLQVQIGAGPAVNVPHLHSDTVGDGNGSLLFFGFISTDSFTSLTLLNSAGPADRNGFDNFYAGMVEEAPPPPVVPEPSSLALVTIGLVVAAGAGRRRCRCASTSPS